MSDDDKLPKQDLLAKILNMTTSDNDGVALVAIRKANALLLAHDWSWDKLLAGKIRVIEDPFKNIGDPAVAKRDRDQRNTGPAAAPPSSFVRPTTPNRPQPPPPPPFQGTPQRPISSTPNRFANYCWCCGIEAVANAGFIFHPPGRTDWKVVCATCNTSAVVRDYPANPVRTPRKKSVQDLA